MARRCVLSLLFPFSCCLLFWVSLCFLSSSFHRRKTGPRHATMIEVPSPPSFSPPPSQRSFVFPSSFSENVIQQPAQTPFPPFRFFPFSFSPGNGGWAEIDGGRMGSSRAPPPPPPPSSLPLREEEEATHVASSFPRRLSPGRKGGGRRTEGGCLLLLFYPVCVLSCSFLLFASPSTSSLSASGPPSPPRSHHHPEPLPPSLTYNSNVTNLLRPPPRGGSKERGGGRGHFRPPLPSGGGKGRELHLPSSAGGIVVACTTS